jgi:hypothetical protein
MKIGDLQIPARSSLIFAKDVPLLFIEKYVIF